jgi:hypothetical protein
VDCLPRHEKLVHTVKLTYTERIATALKLYFYCYVTAAVSDDSPEKFREISRKSEIPENSGKCREIFSGKIPGKSPPDLPAFSGNETNVTALILFFKKSKIKKISMNFGRKFPGNSGKFSPKNVGKFSPNFSVFF